MYKNKDNYTIINSHDLNITAYFQDNYSSIVHNTSLSKNA